MCIRVHLMKSVNQITLTLILLCLLCGLRTSWAALCCTPSVSPSDGEFSGNRKAIETFNLVETALDTSSKGSKLKVRPKEKVDHWKLKCKTFFYIT